MSQMSPNHSDVPTAVPPKTASSVIGWHLIPAAGSFIVGLASALLGLFLAVALIYVVWKDGVQDATVGRVVGCALYLGFGSAWVIAGWFYWRGRYRSALIANGIGLLIWVIVLLAIELA